MGDRQRGASVVEYALLVAGVAAGLIFVALALSTMSRGVFGEQCSLFESANYINADADIEAAKSGNSARC